jgi:D-galactarolactone cycloisomerase
LMTDESGLTGVGESWINFPKWAPWERVAAFERGIIPYLCGKEVADIAAFMKQMENDFRGPSEQARASGPLLSALCAVELAAWDLAAQRAKIPLNRMLFEKPARRVRIYGSGINSPIPFDAIDALLAKGVNLFKLKLGFGDETDLANIRTMQKHLGGRARLAVDTNRGWSFEQALKWLPILKGFGVEWLEEPLRVDAEARLGELLRSQVPISAGENVLMGPNSNAAEAVALPLDILQPDITKFASLSTVLEMVKSPDLGAKWIVPHFLGSAPGQAASIHLASGCRECLVEWDVNPNPLRTELFSEPFMIKDGHIEIPERPGLGWTLAGV